MIHAELWYREASPNSDMLEIVELLKRNPEDESLLRRFMDLATRVGLQSKGSGTLFQFLQDPASRQVLLHAGWDDYAVEPGPGDVANGLYEIVLKNANETEDPDWVGLAWVVVRELRGDPDVWPEELSSKAALRTPESFQPSIKFWREGFTDDFSDGGTDDEVLPLVKFWGAFREYNWEGNGILVSPIQEVSFEELGGEGEGSSSQHEEIHTKNISMQNYLILKAWVTGQ